MADATGKSQEINAGYAITEKITIGEATIVLGRNVKNPNKYVTWRSYRDNGNYNHGNYFDDRLDAIRDYCNRLIACIEREKDYEVIRKSHGEDR